MKRLQFALVALFLCSAASAQVEVTRYQGKVVDGYKILVSSNGICPEGATITRDILFFSSYPAVTRNFVDPYSESNDWLLTVEGTEHAIWIDSSTNVRTSGTHEAYKLATDGTRSLSIDGKVAGNVYVRIKEFLSGWATCYMLTTR